jgi:hypothetical protein
MSRVDGGAHGLVERWQADAATLRAWGVEHEADVLERCATEMLTALPDQADQPPSPPPVQLLTATEVAENLIVANQPTKVTLAKTVTMPAPSGQLYRRRHSGRVAGTGPFTGRPSRGNGYSIPPPAMRELE